MQKATTYLRPSARQVVCRAEVFWPIEARRAVGQPFVTHPCSSTSSQKRGWTARRRSGLLHDTVEDTDMTFQEVEAMFGRDVRGIVEGETKVSKLPKMARELNTLDGDAERERSRTCGPCLTRRKSAPPRRRARRPGPRRVDGVESPRHRADAVTQRRVDGVESPRRRADGTGTVSTQVRGHGRRLARCGRQARGPVANMRTLEFMPLKVRTRIAGETLEIFVPAS